jgi:hypothetical protein
MKMWLKVLIGLAVLGVCASVLVYFFVYNKPHPDYENLKPDFVINAEDLYKSFMIDKTGSEKIYNGKVLQVDGKVSKTEVNDSLAVAVFVFDQGPFGDAGIRCSFPLKFRDEVKKLVPDGSVRIKGYCTGYNDTDVILEECSFTINP